jgi:hypothetical protein
MLAPTINTELMDLSPEEQEVLSGGQQTVTGRIRVDDAVFRYGGKEYPARIRVTVRGLPEIETETETQED